MQFEHGTRPLLLCLFLPAQFFCQLMIFLVESLSEFDRFKPLEGDQNGLLLRRGQKDRRLRKEQFILLTGVSPPVSGRWHPV